MNAAARIALSIFFIVPFLMMMRACAQSKSYHDYGRHQ
jgi:hypothetical protein